MKLKELEMLMQVGAGARPHMHMQLAARPSWRLTLLAACPLPHAQDVAPFEKPKVELEQYPTGPHLASRLLFAVASSYGEFEGRTCIDLGCGTVRWGGLCVHVVCVCLGWRLQSPAPGCCLPHLLLHTAPALTPRLPRHPAAAGDAEHRRGDAGGGARGGGGRRRRRPRHRPLQRRRVR